MQDEVQIDVSLFLWEDRPKGNLEHCARHEVTPVVAEEVKNHRPRFFLNEPEKTATHVMIGPDSTGRFWTIMILDTSDPGTWKPITGWPSHNDEIRRYNGEG